MKGLMTEYGTTQAGKDDAISKAQKEIDDVRAIMTENIDRVLERGERIDLLVDKTDRLGGSARDFRVRSRGLRRRMWWKNVKLMVLFIVVIIFLMYLFVGFACGLPGKLLRHYCRSILTGLQAGLGAYESEMGTRYTMGGFGPLDKLESLAFSVTLVVVMT